jgi:general secretion pathway protein G
MKRLVFKIATVTVIIVGLAVVVGIRFEQTRLSKIRSSETRARIAGLQEALRRFHADNGYYPTTDQGLSALRNYYSLEGGTWDGDPGMVLPRVPLRLPLDAWGNRYLYESDGHTYTLSSPGPRGSQSVRDAIVVRSPKSPD